MKIVAVTNQKGGVGKTTTSVNLAAALAGMGRKVLLVDLDPQGNASGIFQTEGGGSGGLYGALLGEVPAEETIRGTRIENLFLVPADLDLAGAEIEVARMDGHLMQLRKTLARLRESRELEFAILDCPPSLGILMSNGLVAADELIIPIQCEYYALEGLGLLMQVAGQIRDCGANPTLAISGMVMTMYDSRTKLNAAVIEDVKGHFQEVVFETPIPRTVRFGEAPSHAKTILEYDPAGAGAEAYRSLAREFLARQEAGIAFQIPGTMEPVAEEVAG